MPATPPPPSAADHLRRHLDAIEDLIRRAEDPWRLTARTEGIIADIEQAAADLRAIARGYGRR